MSVELALLFWKKRTWSARVGNREDGVLDGRKIGPPGLEERYLGVKSWKKRICYVGWRKVGRLYLVEGTWRASVGNRNYVVLYVKRARPLGFQEGGLGSKSYS